MYIDTIFIDGKNSTKQLFVKLVVAGFYAPSPSPRCGSKVSITLAGNLSSVEPNRYK